MSQLDMFPPPQEAQKPSLRCGKPRSKELIWERARSRAVESAILGVLSSRKGEWLGWCNFRAVIETHQIGSCFGHVLSGMARAGVIREQTVYHGKGIDAEKPGSPNYQGFGHQYSALLTNEIKEAA